LGTYSTPGKTPSKAVNRGFKSPVVVRPATAAPNKNVAPGKALNSTPANARILYGNTKSGGDNVIDVAVTLDSSVGELAQRCANNDKRLDELRTAVESEQRGAGVAESSEARLCALVAQWQAACREALTQYLVCAMM
jgi:hypothetical protein